MFVHWLVEIKTVRKQNKKIINYKKFNCEIKKKIWSDLRLKYVYTATVSVNLCVEKTSNPLKTKRRPLYLKTQSVPRSKHFSSRL